MKTHMSHKMAISDATNAVFIFLNSPVLHPSTEISSAMLILYVAALKSSLRSSGGKFLVSWYQKTMISWFLSDS